MSICEEVPIGSFVRIIELKMQKKDRKLKRSGASTDNIGSK